MSKDKYNAPQGSDSEFVDEILAEARKMRGNVTEELDDQDIPLAQARPVGNMYKQTKKPAEPVPKPKPVVNPPTPEMNPPAISPEMPQQPAPQPGSNVINQEDAGTKKKKKRFGKKNRQEVTAGEDDIYFGLKLKTVEEVKAQRREELNKEGYSGGPLQVSSPTSTFAHLFEDNEPDTSPEFEEKFRQLHRQRQERVKRAAQEAGEEVEDVFSLYEESKEAEPVYSDLKIPEPESPEKIVEELVSDTFRKQEQPAISAKRNDDVIEHQLYEEDLQAEKQNAELRQLIDDVLAKETVVEVDPPLHTESIFGLVAKERTQDTVNAEIAEEEKRKEVPQPVEIEKEEMQESSAESFEPVAQVEQEDELDIPNFVSYPSSKTAPVHETPKKEHAHQNAQTAEIVEESDVISEEQSAKVVVEPMQEEPSQEHLSAEIQSETFEEPLSAEQTETAQKIEQPIEMSEVAKETTDAVQNETSQAEQLSDDVPLEQPVEMPQASLSQASKAQEAESLEREAATEADSQNVEQTEPSQEEQQTVAAAEVVEEKDIDLVTKPVQYVFNKRPVRTFSIHGIGDVLAQEAEQFTQLLHPETMTKKEQAAIPAEPKVTQVKEDKPKEAHPQESAKNETSKPQKKEDSHQESARKPSGPRIIRTARFQIIDKTNAGQPDEVSNIEHIEPQESNTSVPSDSNMETDVAEQKSEIPEVKDNKASSADQNTKIVNLQDIKAKKQQPPIDLNHMEQVPEYVPKKKKNIFRREKINLFTDIEDEEEIIPEEAQEEQPELEDFTSKEDARSIAGELRKNIRTLFLRSVVTGICTAVLLIFGFFAEYHIFGADISPVAYAATSLVFLAIAIGACATTVFNGLKALVKLRANADSAIAIATVVIAIQSVVLLFMQDALAAGEVHIYSALITGGLLLNTLGKLTMVRRIKQNFNFVVSSADKITVELIENAEIAAQMAKDCVAGIPVVAYQKKSKFFSNFLRNSYAQDCSELTSQIIAPLGFISSLVLFIVSMIISKNVGTGFTAFAASMCICVPMANMLCVHLPVSRLCKLARKNGGMLVGYEAVDKFSDTNVIMIEADDLFPKGTVELKGIKTFGEQRIDKVLLDAASLMAQVGGPLSEVFLEVVKNHEDILPHVENVAYEDECGVIGWVSGRRILVGNRDLMNHYSVDVPAVQIDREHGHQLVYLAAGNEVVGAFVLAYHVSSEKKQEMQRMAKNGIGIIVKTTDPSVTAEFISQQFGIDIHAITVLSGPLVHTYNELTNQVEETSNAMFATKGKATCMMRVITACVREKSNISIVRLLQNISIILGFVLVAFLVCFSGLKQISTLAMVIYEVFWLVVLLILPKIRRS